MLSPSVAISSWLKAFNISMASEGQQRDLAKDLTGGIVGEMVSFSFPNRQRGHVLQQAPYVWIQDLQQKIVDTLQYNSRYCFFT